MGSTRPLPSTLVGALALALAACLAVSACSSPTAATQPPTPTGTPAGKTPEAPTQEPATPAATSPEPTATSACAPTDATGDVAVTIAGFSYDPNPVRASVGQPITWTNTDGAPHTATLVDTSCSTDGLGRGDSGSLVFSEPGSYPYLCRIHPDAMKGTIEIEG